MKDATWGQWLDRFGLRELYSKDEWHALDERVWSPDPRDAQAAWKMAVELRTRISTQPMAFRDGDESSALKSVYGLFELFRRLAKEEQGARIFYELGVRVLNGKVRAFTAQWHPVDLAGQLSGTDASFHFRTALLNIQRILRGFCSLLEAMANMPSEPPGEPTGGDGLSYFNDAVAIAAVQNDSDGKLARVITNELVDIRLRRNGGDTERINNDAPVMDGVGLALSGGGIRSATFALGVVSELARRGIMNHIDYLSTVSGGGYLGSFITSTVGNVPHHENPFQSVFGDRGGAETLAVRALRNHSKYLVEGGIKTAATLVGTVLYGLITTALLVAPFLLVLIAFIAWMMAGSGGRPWVAPVGLVLFGLGYLTTQVAGLRYPPSQLSALFGVGVLGLALATLASLLRLDVHTMLQSATIGLVVFSSLFVACLACLGVPSLRAHVPGGLLWSATGLVLWGVIAASAHIPDISDLLLCAVVLMGLGLVVNLNVASPHPFYKERLANTYLLDREGRPTGQPQPLSNINASGQAPYHLLCAALNVPGSKNADLRGRRSDFFLFSKYACGSVLTGYEASPLWTQAGNSPMDLATAMAVSGAAASPNMGRRSVRAYGYALALLNLRLGYWVRKPGSRAWLLPHWYFGVEMRQRFDEHASFLNISDGGHIENLGVFELLRRRCKFIIAVDGEADPQRSFEGLLHVVHLARVDLNTRIEPRLDRLRADDQGIGRSHFELFHIRYPDDAHGLILYLKASLTGNEPETIRRYRAEHPDFPHESTAKQLYSEHQFEAYRLLGEHIAADLFHPALLGGEPLAGAGDWLRRLASHFLRASD